MEMIRPNLFVVGAPKCGTTAWVEYLSSHPDICFSRLKEPHFFNTDFPGFRWVKSEEGYLSLFSDCKKVNFIGEASVQYLYSKEAANNIFKFSPRAKILIFLRSPASFIRSYHNQLILNADEDELSLRRAWGMSGLRGGSALPKSCREPKFLDYKSVGLFSEQVQRYVDLFPAENVKVLFFEDWITSPRSTYLEIIRFLGIDDDGRNCFPRVHGAKKVVNQRINKLTQRPPRVLTVLMSLIKKIPGMRGFKPSRLIRSLNTRDGYKATRDLDLENEIKNFFDEDQKRLCRILAKSS